jgi:hypothetical protein
MNETYCLSLPELFLRKKEKRQQLLVVDVPTHWGVITGLQEFDYK